MNSHPPEETVTLIDRLLDEQRQLTAVERFARIHRSSEVPAQELHYRSLIPLERPRPGEQYAFSVDLDSCTGCKACVSACHSLNGLDENETWRSTGLLHGGTEAEPYQQVVTTACHHCLDPACLNGCPVLAYEKDPVSGIVRHLDDQCIGCQYCLLKCPYDVPKYSAKRGIVRKCDMCHGRLAEDEAPACVQGCPNKAITIRLVSRAEVTRSGAEPGRRLVPGTVASACTLPTTTYTSRRPMPANAAPADAHSWTLQPAHWPLIWMLLLTQAAAGIFLMTFFFQLIQPSTFMAAHVQLATAGACLLQAGLAASVFHLGKPLGAWRAFLGWRRSWMSREILAFGAFAAAALTLALAAQMQWKGLPMALLGGLAAGLGLLSVFCSAMIYADTERVSWRAERTLPKFFGTTLLLGAAAVAALLAWTAEVTGARLGSAIAIAAWLAILTRTALLVGEGKSLFAALRDSGHSDHRPACLIWSHRQRLVLPRVVLFVISTASGLLAVFGAVNLASTWAAASFVSTFASQLLERYTFFAAATAPRMPGGLEA